MAVPGERIPVTRDYQVPFAARVKRGSGVVVSTVGLFDDGVRAEQVLGDGDEDAIVAGGDWMSDPHFALCGSVDLAVRIPYWPLQYARACRTP